MIIYAKYDEDDEVVDVIYIPENPIVDIELMQNDFLKWLFDKSNNHEYWKGANGEKTYCEYDVEAFVKWLNETVYANFLDKAKVIKKNSFEKISDFMVLFF